MAAGRKASDGAAAAALVALLVVAAATAASAVCGVDSSAVDECRSFCTVGSTDDRPSDTCCDMVKAADWSCLCRFKRMLPEDIDPNRVMQIPYKCSKGRKPPATCRLN